MKIILIIGFSKYVIFWIINKYSIFEALGSSYKKQKFKKKEYAIYTHPLMKL